MNRTSLQVLMVSLVLSLAPSMNADAVKIAVPDTLMQAATQHGSVRVIVTLQKPELPDRASRSQQDFDEILKGKVSSIQSAVLDKLPANALVGVARRFDFTSQFAATVTPEGLRILANDPTVLIVQEDRLSHPFLDQSVPHIFPGNDISPHTGNGQAVAVLDAGVDKSHPFLSGKVVSEACYSTNYADASFTSASACPGGVSSSTATGSGVPCNPSYDGCDHGTHVAGIASGFQNNSLHGVAKEGDIIAVQVFSEFSVTPLSFCSGPCALTFDSDQIGGLNHVYALRNTYDIAAVNMSLGGGGPFNTACDGESQKPSIDLLRGAGIATIIASGNDSFTTGISSPACISSAIAVGATNNTVDTRASFSNVGGLLDMYAPGVDINSSVPGSGFVSWNGTSMATPHVAGAWAIMKDAKPAATVNEILTAFKSTGVNVISAGVTRKRIDVDAALAELLSSPPPPSEDDDFILSVMPPIFAAVQDGAPLPPPVPNPQWSAITEICCSISSATYSVTQGSQSRSSALSSCSDTTATFGGFLTTTPGSKFFSHNVTSSGCGSLTGSGSQSLQSGKRYLWVAEFNGGNPQFVLYSENISSATGNLTANSFSSRGTTDGMVVETSGPLILEQGLDGQAAFQGLLQSHSLP